MVIFGATAYSHGTGPGMVITCTSNVSGVPFGVNAGVTVHNAANGQFKSVPIANGSSASGVCTAVLNAAAQAGLRVAFENMNSVAIYGAGNSVTVSFASIAQQDF
jgi:hypothetical protein